MEDFLETVLPSPPDTGAFGRSYPEIFLCTPNFVVLRKMF